MSLLLLLPALLACKPIEAPQDLEELVVFGFDHMDDDGYPEATADELIPLADGQFTDLQDGYEVNSLTPDDLAEAGVESADTTDIIGAMGGVDYTHSIDEVLALLTRGDKEDLYEDEPVYDLLEPGDVDCFLSHDCETLEQVITEGTSVAILGVSTRTYTQQYRWVDDEDLGPLVLIRTLNPDGMTFDVNWLVVYQQYAFIALFPEGDHARRVETFWVDAEFIGMDVPENTAVNQAVSQMSKQAEQVDELIDELEATGDL